MAAAGGSSDIPITTRDAQAFAALYEEWWLTVYGAAAAMLECAHDAEDAAQRVFARLWASGGWRRVDRPERFFRRAGRNEALTILREKEGRRSLPLDRELASVLKSPGRSPERALFASAARDEAMRLISLLPPRCRLVCTLVFLLGLTHAEVAERVGITVGAVDKQVARGRRRIRAIVGPGQSMSNFVDGG